MILSVRKTYGFFLLLSFLFSLQVGAAPLCSVIFIHDFTVDEFADVRHAGALDVFLEPQQRWLKSAKMIPQYQAVTSMPTRLNLSEIHFMQSHASNNFADAKYTVVENARALRDGKLNSDNLPPLGVWQDTSGKIWTVDHRRLASLILSGKIETVKVHWVEKAEVERQRYKMNTLAEGNFLLLTAKRRQSILVEKPGAKSLVTTTLNRKNIPKYTHPLKPEEMKQTAWQEDLALKNEMPLAEVLFSKTMSEGSEPLQMAARLREGKEAEPVLRVWLDSSGRTWTIDNDLLAALRLAERQGVVKVRYLSFAEYQAMGIAVDSQTAGRSYVVPANDGNSALVIHK